MYFFKVVLVNVPNILQTDFIHPTFIYSLIYKAIFLKLVSTAENQKEKMRNTGIVYTLENFGY